jgi:hypothetical protein
MTAIIKVHGLATGEMFKHDMWVEHYDLDAIPPQPHSYFTDDGGAVVHGMFGGIIHLTPHREDALQFPSSAEAMAAWNTASQHRPKRPDGRPNKPLTALTVEVEPT